MVGTVNDIDELVDKSYLDENMHQYPSPIQDMILAYDEKTTGKFYLLERVKDTTLYRVFARYFD